MNVLLVVFICFCDSLQDVCIAKVEGVIKRVQREKVKINGNYLPTELPSRAN